jgi:hypothetical protein
MVSDVGEDVSEVVLGAPQERDFYGKRMV